MLRAVCRRYVESHGAGSTAWPTEYVFILRGVPGHSQPHGSVKRGAFKGGWTSAQLSNWRAKRAAEAVRSPRPRGPPGHAVAPAKQRQSN